jgi:hypothetical protein
MTDFLRRAVTMHAEQRTFRQLLDDELAGQVGRYVVIVGDRLLGAFDDYNEAMVAGFKACGFTPFLLKKVPAPAAQRLVA